MTPDDIAELIDVGEPRLSPDGGVVAFVVTTVDLDANAYKSRVWVAAADASTPPRPFTAGEHRDSRPRWSPDGTRLAFVSHRVDKGSELYVIPFAGGGELVRAATWPEEIEELEWSPDGTRLAFTARRRDEERYGAERDKDRPARNVTRVVYRLDSVGWTIDRPRHLFVVAADGSSPPAALTDGDADHAGISWSPDGETIAFAAGRHDTWDRDQCVDLWTIPTTGGEPAPLTETGKAFSRPSFSPDGRTLAFTWSDPARYPGHGQVGVIGADGGNPRLLTEGVDRQCTPFLKGSREPVWVGDRLLFLVEDAGNTHLYAVGVDDDKPQALIQGDREVTGFDAAAGTVAFCATSPTQLAELHVHRGGDEHALTALGGAFAARRPLVAPERFVATATDGSEVEAWIMRPAGFEQGHRYPTLLNIHGGPFTQYGNRFFDEFQIQAGAGYAVVYANPRGSSGYSAAWAQAICGPDSFAPGTGWGGADYDDLMAVCDAALARFDFIDPGRLGVMGGSYGGFMTSWAIGHTGRFKAACSERAVNNHLSFCGTSDIGVRFPKCYFGPSHLDDPDLYLRQSPITYVRDIRTPVLILHSDNDLRCPVEQAEQLFVALKLLDRDVTFIRFPGEGHELSRAGSPRHRAERMRIILDWFAQNL
jgi:dipeptidyl aminopeptidase/acylaminoacyl peptidase